MTELDSSIIKCRACGAKNRIPSERSSSAAKCGKCGQPLPDEAEPAAGGLTYTLRCSACRTRNKIPAEKVDAGAKCGKCGLPMDTAALFVPQPVMVTDQNFDQMVLQSPLPVLLFAWATWCPSCGSYAPVIDEFARDAKTRVRVVKMNMDNSPVQASKYNIMSVPFMFIFDNGQMKESFPGGLPKQELMIKMTPYI